ncbi:MAG TPA: BppU family phage baseplate upper protein, partial [Pseudothermotoga sp.]
MFLKEHNISVRLPQEKTIDTGIVFVQNDKDVYKLNIRVFDGVYEIDYTEVEEATITFSKADGTVVQGDMQIEADQLTYVLGTNEIAAPGKLIATIQLLGANERLTTARFVFNVEKDLITEDAVKSTSEFPILQQLKEDLEAIDVVDLTNQFNAHLADYADLKGYIGYTDNDIVGVEADFVNNKFTRLAGAVGKNPGADFDSINAFGGRRRCNLADDGTVNAYYGEPGYIEDGSNGQVMVEQPKFYYKVVPLQLEPITDGIGYHLRKARYYVSDTPKVGFKVHPAFVRNGVEVDKIYLSAYEGSIYDESAGTYLLADEQVADFDNDKLSSIAGAKPASGLTQILTRANTRKLAENRGAGWQQKDVLCASASQMLMMIEYAAFNMQSAIGLGVVNKPSGEGNESELTGATSNLGNASGMADGTNGLVSISYRGEENFWGNIWTWVDGLNIYNQSDLYVADHDFVDNSSAEPYKDAGITLAKTSGYVSAFGYNEEFDWLFFPSET